MVILGKSEENKYGQRWAIMHVFNIPARDDPERVYLKRLRILQTPWFGLYLHHINEADSDRDPHDHPWPFLSFVVRGGYTERVWRMLPGGVRGRAPVNDEGKEQSHARFSLHRHPTSIAHSITALEPNTVTLLLVGRRTREWGFWTPEGFVEWKQYERLLP